MTENRTTADAVEEKGNMSHSAVTPKRDRSIHGVGWLVTILVGMAIWGALFWFIRH